MRRVLWPVVCTVPRAHEVCTGCAGWESERFGEVLYNVQFKTTTLYVFNHFCIYSDFEIKA